MAIQKDRKGINEGGSGSVHNLALNLHAPEVDFSPRETLQKVNKKEKCPKEETRLVTAHLFN